MLWQIEKANRCPGCGMPVDEAWVFSSEQHAEYLARYSAEIRLCVPCERMAEQREEAQKLSHKGGTYTIVKENGD